MVTNQKVNFLCKCMTAAIDPVSLSSINDASGTGMSVADTKFIRESPIKMAVTVAMVERVHLLFLR